MFLMKNKLGNAILIAKTEARRDELKRYGFTVIEDDKGNNISAFDKGFIKGLRGSTFSKMKKDELIAYAEEHNIDISSANTKDEIIANLSAE